MKIIQPFSSFITLATGVGGTFWKKSHNLHHIFVNNFEHDSNDFVSLFKNKWKLLPSFFLLPIFTLKSMIENINENKLFIIENVALLGNIYLTKNIFQKNITVLLVSYCFYIVTFMVTQWFHHPKTLSQSKSRIIYQILNSRNIVNSSLVFYWMGGHNYQIEHHLIPHLPRYLLPEFSKELKIICRKYNFQYNEITVYDCFVEILNTWLNPFQFNNT